MIAVILIGSAGWFGLQVLAWSIGLALSGQRGYQTLRIMVIGALVAFPIFVLLVESLRFLFGFSENGEAVIMSPVFTAWILLLSWGGLQLAARLRGLHLHPPAAPRAKPDASAELESGPRT